MEIILLEHVDKLGKMGDKVNVKNGYARNYLLPQKKALRATEANVAYFEKQKAELEAHNKKLLEAATAKAEALKGFSAMLIRQAAETGMVPLPFATLLPLSKLPVLMLNAVAFIWKARLKIWVSTKLS